MRARADISTPLHPDSWRVSRRPPMVFLSPSGPRPSMLTLRSPTAVDKEISEAKLSLNARARIVAESFLSSVSRYVGPAQAELSLTSRADPSPAALSSPKHFYTPFVTKCSATPWTHLPLCDARLGREHERRGKGDNRAKGARKGRALATACLQWAVVSALARRFLPLICSQDPRSRPDLERKRLIAREITTTKT